MAEHGNWPIFSTEFGKIVYILVDVGNKNTVGHRNFHFGRYLAIIGSKVGNHTPWNPPKNIDRMIFKFCYFNHNLKNKWIHDKKFYMFPS